MFKTEQLKINVTSVLALDAFNTAKELFLCAASGGITEGGASLWECDKLSLFSRLQMCAQASSVLLGEQKPV